MNRLFFYNQNIGKIDRKLKNPSQKKSFDFSLYKKNTIQSLNDIEFFLNNFNYYSKYLKLYKFMKK